MSEQQKRELVSLADAGLMENKRSERLEMKDRTGY